MCRLLPLLTVLFVWGCDVPDDLNPPVLGNHDLTSETRTLGPITGVRSKTALRMVVTEGATQSVVLRIDSNLHEYLDVEAVDGVLVVQANHNITFEDDARLEVVVPRLVRVELESAGAITAGPFTTREPRVDLENTSAGALRWEGDADEVYAVNSSSGLTTLVRTGDTLDYAELTVASAGALNARDLPTHAAKLTNSSSGKLTATLTGGDLRLALSSAGDIEWHGTANVLSQSDTGSGSIIHVP